MRPEPLRRRGEAANIGERIYARGPLVMHAADIDRRPGPRGDLVPREQLHILSAAAQFLCEGFDIAHGWCRVRSADPPPPIEIAGDVMGLDQTADTCSRPVSERGQPIGPFATEFRCENRPRLLDPRYDLPAIATGSTRADIARIQEDDRRAALREVQRGRDAEEPTADDRDIGARIARKRWARGTGRRRARPERPRMTCGDHHASPTRGAVLRISGLHFRCTECPLPADGPSMEAPRGVFNPAARDGI
jgi:hypothetical protein